MIQSPYELHKYILLDDTYGTARRLQDFVLYQYESGRYPFDINEYIGGFDRRHLQIYSDLKQWFWENGPDPFFNEIAQTIIDRRRATAQANFEELTRLREMQPEAYPVDPGESPIYSHKVDLENHEMFHRRYVAGGFWDE
ncbi:hypothetical protein [Pseudomonas fluorescens]|uniref:Uncharacterized protein n=1 Tax=Pseudomonas fluorescens TaxID=294 RepID=A0A5E7CBQ8_PSEFL|nr:hypothetical protein [Pseudomonas fluorescens]VVO01611.1 hypothetical protein PS691_02675 [Pseudomonas fluorescens]